MSGQNRLCLVVLLPLPHLRGALVQVWHQGASVEKIEQPDGGTKVRAGTRGCEEGRTSGVLRSTTGKALPMAGPLLSRVADSRLGRVVGPEDIASLFPEV